VTDCCEVERSVLTTINEDYMYDNDFDLMTNASETVSFKTAMQTP